jgi:predicted SAM-dependent methyltransferase
MKKVIRSMHLEVAAVALKHHINSRIRRIVGKDRRIISEYLNKDPEPKLQIACGSNHPDGWLNTDYYHPSNTIACLDITKRFPFSDNTFTVVLAEHVIEHFAYLDGKAIMVECFRTLKPGGILRLSTPNLLFYANLFDPTIFEKYRETYVIPHQTAWIPYADQPRASYILNNLVRNWRHLFVYDFETLKALLSSVGFSDIELKEIGESKHPALQGVDRLARDKDDFESQSNMVLDATKPG